MSHRKRKLLALRPRNPPGFGPPPGSRHLRLYSQSIGAEAIGATAIGSLAVGALAIGALALGALAIGRLAIGRARIRRVEIDELVVRRLRITEKMQLPDELKETTPSAEVSPAAAPDEAHGRSL